MDRSDGHSFFINGNAVNATGSFNPNTAVWEHHKWYEFSSSLFNTLQVKGDTKPSSQSLSIDAFDGTNWSSAHDACDIILHLKLLKSS